MTPAARNPVAPAEVLRTGSEPARGTPPEQMPRSLEAEMALLGAMIFDNEVIGDVVETVSAREMFSYPAHQTIFETLLNLHMARKPIDLVVLKDELAKDRRLEAVGGAEYLASLVDTMPTAANALEYAQTVHDRFVLRNIIETCSKIVHQATSVTQDVDAVRDEAEKALFQALARGEKGTVRTMGDILRKTFQQIEDIRDRKSRLLGLSTGYYEIDDLTSGLQDGQLYIVAGRPSMGKTSLAMSMVENVALKEQKPVLFFSLEMAATQVSQAMLCSHARVDSSLLRSGRVSEEDYQRLVLAAGALHEAKILIDDPGDISILELRARARLMKAREGIRLVVVDCLQKIGAPGETRQECLALVSSQLKALAMELGLPVVALAQLNRSAEWRKDHRPILSDLGESEAVEEAADAVFLLYREEYYHVDCGRPGVCEVIVAKNRGGPTGTVDLAFLKRLCRFENLRPPPPFAGAP